MYGGLLQRVADLLRLDILPPLSADALKTEIYISDVSIGRISIPFVYHSNLFEDLQLLFVIDECSLLSTLWLRRHQEGRHHHSQTPEKR